MHNISKPSAHVHTTRAYLGFSLPDSTRHSSRRSTNFLGKAEKSTNSPCWTFSLQWRAHEVEEEGGSIVHRHRTSVETNLLWWILHLPPLKVILSEGQAVQKEWVTFVCQPHQKFLENRTQTHIKTFYKRERDHLRLLQYLPFCGLVMWPHSSRQRCQLQPACVHHWGGKGRRQWPWLVHYNTLFQRYIWLSICHSVIPK